MDINDTLGYIRVLREREFNANRRRGVTAWGLLAAMVYLATTVIPPLAKIQTDHGEGGLLLLYYSHIYAVVLSGAHLFLGNYPGSPNNPFDYRVSGVRDTSEKIRAIFWLMVIVLVPAGSTHLAINYAHDISYIHQLQLLLNRFLYIVFFLAFLGILVAYLINTTQDGYPAPMDVPARHSTAQKISYHLFRMISVEVFLSNIYFFFTDLFSKNYVSENIFLSSFILVIITFAVYMYRGVSNENRLMIRLERLERDIMLHNLSNDDAISRLKDECLGNL